MTAIDRFDPFERRISEAIDEIADARPPEYLADALRHTARTSQRPRWTFPSVLLHADRTFDQSPAASLALLLLAALLIALVGGVLWFGSQPHSLQGPLVESLTGRWEAPKDGLSFGTPSGATTEALVIDPALGSGALRVSEQGFPVGVAALVSSIVSVSAFEVELRTTSVAPLGGRGFERGTPVAVNGDPRAGCELGDVGRYRWSLSSDKSVLTLESLGDACPSRESVLARTWSLVQSTSAPEISAA